MLWLSDLHADPRTELGVPVVVRTICRVHRRKKRNACRNRSYLISNIGLIKDGDSFCYCAYVLRILGYLPTNKTIFCAVFDYVEKAVLGKGYRGSETRLGVTTPFSEIIELKFGKKLSYIFLYFNAFLELWLLNCL